MTKPTMIISDNWNTRLLSYVDTIGNGLADDELGSVHEWGRYARLGNVIYEEDDLGFRTIFQYATEDDAITVFNALREDYYADEDEEV